MNDRLMQALVIIATGTHSLLNNELSPWRGLVWAGKNLRLQKLKKENF